MSALAEALVAAQAELPCALGKDATGEIGDAQRGTRMYRYLTLDKLIAETRPILTRHGLAILQFPSYEVIDGKTFPILVTRVQLATETAQSVDAALYGTDLIETRMPLYDDPSAEPDTGEVKDAALAPHEAEVRTERDA